MKLLLGTLSILTVAVSAGNLTTGHNTNNLNSNNNLKITNGKDVKPGAYPWFGMITLKGQPLGVGGGGGVLISPQWFLTAAHVAQHFDNSWCPPSNMEINFGIYDVKHPYKPETRFGSKIFIFNGIDNWNLKQDIALVKLNQPINDIKPIKFATANQKPAPGTIVKGIGFGLCINKQGKNYWPTKMQEADFPIQDPSIAKNPKYNVVDFDQKYDLLAGTITGKRVNDALGDSGGPLIEKINNQWTAVGIASHAGLDYPNIWIDPLPLVYTWDGAFSDWINTTMKNN